MTQLSNEKLVVAAFDFDGTLTRHDTLFPFLLHIAGFFNLFIKIIYLSPILAAYALRLLRNDVAKVKVLRCFVAEMEMQQLQQQALSFAATKIPSMLRDEAMQRLAWHQQQGHRCVLVSASLELYLRPWASAVGFNDVLGSRLEERENGRTSGRLAGKNCFGPEKMHRLEALLGPRERYTLYAYGDSRGDKELLSAADYPYYQSFTHQGQHK